MLKMLIEIHNDGLLLEMDDSTKWEVDPYDASICCSWTPTNEMKITENKSNSYPYTIKDSGSELSVRARLYAE